MKDFDHWLQIELWHPLLRLDAPYRALRATQSRLVGGQIRNQIAWEVYTHAVNGWMIHASDYGRRLEAVLERIKQDHRREFRRNLWKDIHAQPERINIVAVEGIQDLEALRQQMAIESANRDRKDFKRRWDHYFPTSREKGMPTHNDLDALKRRLTKIGKPLRDHRNTVSAHPEAAEKLPAAWKQVNRAFVAQRAVVASLYFLRTRGVLLFDLPTASAEAETLAAVLAKSIQRAV